MILEPCSINIFLRAFLEELGRAFIIYGSSDSLFFICQKLKKYSHVRHILGTKDWVVFLSDFDITYDIPFSPSEIVTAFSKNRGQSFLIFWS